MIPNFISGCFIKILMEIVRTAVREVDVTTVTSGRNSPLVVEHVFVFVVVHLAETIWRPVEARETSQKGNEYIC